MTEVTFGDFCKLARKRGWTVDFLTERFRGAFGDRGDVRDFFERVFQGRYAANVIPYRSVLKFFFAELGFHQSATGSERRCACGCGQRVFDRRKWASETCRKRGQRQRVSDRENSPEKALNLQGATRDISGEWLPTPSPAVNPGHRASESPVSVGAK